MNKLITWLQQPYPFETEWQSVLRFALIGAGFVFVYLYVFRPFGVQVQSGQEWVYFRSCLHFAAITFVIGLLCQAVLRVFPNDIKEETWTVGREVVFTFFFVSCIAVGNMVYSAYVYGYSLSGGVFLNWLWMTWAVGVFPIAYSIFAKHAKWNNQFKGEAAGLSAQLHHKTEQPKTQSKTIVLEGDNQNESLALAVEDLVYIAAADNYVQVYFLKYGGIGSQMLRSSLKKVESALADVPQLFRCHRTYLVNMDKVVDVSGNAQGYKLHFEGITQLIPVSRSLNETIKNRLN